MKRTGFIVMFANIAFMAFAGNLALLENLGFSPEGRYFMFGQHLFLTDEGQAYAETIIIDVLRNDFVPGGYKKGGWNVPMWPNQHSRGALYELLGESLDRKTRYGISHLEQGRLLYASSGDEEISMEEEEKKEAEALLFRDFEKAREYAVILNQEINTEKSGAAFFIDLTVSYSNGSVGTHKIGRPGFFRPGVNTYRIMRIWVGPMGRSLVIAVAKEMEDLSLRYMVESLRLKN